MLQVKTFTLGMFAVHNYLLFDTETKTTVLIDTGKAPYPILDFIAENKLDLKLLLYTHTHIDHVEGNQVIRDAYPDLPAWMHAEEQFWVDALPMQAQMFGMDKPPIPMIPGRIEPGQVFDCGTFTLESRFCPGHTPGGMSFYVPKGPFLFSGDTIFAGSIGRTDFPKGDFETLIQSIKTQVLTLPDETIIYSGHGEETTVGIEKAQNPYILQSV